MWLDQQRLVLRVMADLLQGLHHVLEPVACVLLGHSVFDESWCHGSANLQNVCDRVNIVDVLLPKPTVDGPDKVFADRERHLAAIGLHDLVALGRNELQVNH